MNQLNYNNNPYFQNVSTPYPSDIDFKNPKNYNLNANQHIDSPNYIPAYSNLNNPNQMFSPQYYPYANSPHQAYASNPQNNQYEKTENYNIINNVDIKKNEIKNGMNNTNSDEDEKTPKYETERISSREKRVLKDEQVGSPTSPDDSNATYQKNKNMESRIRAIKDPDYLKLSNNSEPKQHIKLLLIGRTGAGKTTLINVITNMFYKKEYTDERLIAIKQNIEIIDGGGNARKYTLKNNIDEFGEKQSDFNSNISASQTTECNIYTFENDNLILSLIDTPGLGDTNGYEQDQQNVATIVNGVQKVHDFNAICLVHKGTDAKQDTILKYLISELKGMLTKECQNNFIVCFTAVVSKFKIDATHAIQAMGIPIDKKVYFENDCLIPAKLLPDLDSNYLDTAKIFWKTNKLNYKQLLDYAGKMQPRKSKALKELHAKKSTLILLVNEEAHKVDELNQEKIVLQRYQKEDEELLLEMNNNKDYEYQVDDSQPYTVTEYVEVIEEKDISPDKITQCFVCLNYCHNPCYLDDVYVRGDVINMKNCSCFSGKQTCQRSPCNHGIDVHGHTQIRKDKVKKPVTKTEYKIKKVKKTNEHKKNSYNQATNAQVQLQQNMVGLKSRIQQLEKDLESSYKTMAYLYNNIQKDSLEPINEYFLEYLEFQEKEVRKRTDISETSLRNKLKQINLSRSEYRYFKTIVEKCMKEKYSPLSEDEEKKLKNRIEVFEANQARLLRLYQSQINHKK